MPRSDERSLADDARQRGGGDISDRYKVRRLAFLALAALVVSGSICFGDEIGRDDFSPEAIDINFDEFPDGTEVPNETLINSQYAELGVLFSGPLNDPEANGDFQEFYGPLASPPNVLLAGSTPRVRYFGKIDQSHWDSGNITNHDAD